MVVFTCQNCGESLKKTVVEKHYNVSKCRLKRPNLTCVDCLKDFIDQDYNTHTECMTESERYSAKGTVMKVKTGKVKQEKYVNMIQNLLNSKDLTNTQRNLLNAISKYNNVPRKESKFLNFMRNVHKRATIEEYKNVFKLIEDTWSKEQETDKSVAAVNETSVCKNTDNETDSTSQSCDKPKNGKYSNTKENNQLLEEVKENDTKTNDSIDESRGNSDEMSRKQLKKLKKRQKYLLELENEQKNNLNEANDNVADALELKETAIENGERDFKKSKKSKKTKGISDQMNSLENGDVAEKPALTEETVSKKHKKRKLVDSIPEIAEKKNKLDSSEGGEDTQAQQTFNWAEVIVKVLQSREDNELSLKRLGKKVVNEYLAVKSDHHTFEQLLAKFDKKVKKTPGVRVLKDKAKLLE